MNRRIQHGGVQQSFGTCRHLVADRQLCIFLKIMVELTSPCPRLSHNSWNHRCSKVSEAEEMSTMNEDGSCVVSEKERTYLAMLKLSITHVAH